MALKVKIHELNISIETEGPGTDFICTNFQTC